MARNSASPRVANIVGSAQGGDARSRVEVDERARQPRATSSSTVVLPAPMKPISATCGSLSGLPVDPLQVGPMRRDEVDKRVAANFSRARVRARMQRRPPPRPQAPPRRPCPSARRAPRWARRSRDPRPQRPHERGQGLHRGARDDLLPVRDAGLDTAGGWCPGGHPLSSRTISSCAWEPRRPASSKPSPISTPSRPGCPSARGQSGVEPFVAGRTSRGPAERRSRAPRRCRLGCRGPPARRPRAPRARPDRSRCRPPRRPLPATALSQPRPPQPPPPSGERSPARARRARRRGRTSSRPRDRRGRAAAWYGLRALARRLATGLPRAHAPVQFT